jgi:hypothetical protein
MRRRPNKKRTGPGEDRCVLRGRDREADYFATGIENSAPFSVLSGQRCMIDFCFV